MTQRSHSAARVLVFAGAALIMSACFDIMDSSSSSRQLNVTLTRSSSDAANFFPGNYISVLDTAILTMTSSSGDLLSSNRVKLDSQQTTVAFSVTAKDGPVVFDARIASNNGTTLFTATQPVRIGPGNDTVSIDMKAVGPVLVVSLDFARDYPTGVFSSVSGWIFAFRTTVHNGGVGNLQWEIDGDSTCLKQGALCAPMRGTVGNVVDQPLYIAPFDTLRRPIVIKSAGGKVQFSPPRHLP